MSVARIGRHSWQGLTSDYAAKLQKIKKLGAVNMEIGKNRISMIDIADRRDFDAFVTADPASVSIRAEDFISIARTLFDLAIAEEVQIALADGIMRIELATELAHYCVYVPTLRADGTRSDKLLKKLDFEPWPKSRAD